MAEAPSQEEDTTESQYRVSSCPRDDVKGTAPHWPSKCDDEYKSDLPHITKADEMLERTSLSREERLLAFADLYGRKPPSEIERDQNLKDFEREMSRLPLKQKFALHKGYTVKQALLFLLIENNDAKCAAERMARYWLRRVEILGEDAMKEEHLPRRTQEDFHRVYEMALKAPLDPEVDEETRQWSIKFVSEWNQAHLVYFDQELENIPAHEKAAFVEAQRARPEMVSSDKFKLLFLRCEDFDARRASLRIVKYWDWKFNLFGQENALRSVTVSDLLRDHPGELSLGCFWNIPGTDAFGRSLVLFVNSKVMSSLMPDQGCTEKGVLKVVWYMIHALLEEEKSCRENGIVVLSDDRLTNFSFFKPKLGLKLKSLLHDSLPVKIKAVHVVAQPAPSFFRIFLPFGKWVVGKTLRMRLWVHTGTDEKTLSELEECGISRDFVPTTFGGELDIDRFGRAWLEEREDAGL